MRISIMQFATIKSKETYVCDEVEEVYTTPVERQDVVGALLGVGHSLHGEETGAEQRPLGQEF